MGHEHAFDAEGTAILVSAYEQAIRSLGDSGQPDLVREIIAKKIIAAAMQGERDPTRLCASALEGIGERA